jgi:hypothetical protein
MLDTQNQTLVTTSYVCVSVTTPFRQFCRFILIPFFSNLIDHLIICWFIGTFTLSNFNHEDWCVLGCSFNISMELFSKWTKLMLIYNQRSWCGFLILVSLTIYLGILTNGIGKPWLTLGTLHSSYTLPRELISSSISCKNMNIFILMIFIQKLELQDIFSQEILAIFWHSFKHCKVSIIVWLNLQLQSNNWSMARMHGHFF